MTMMRIRLVVLTPVLLACGAEALEVRLQVTETEQVARKPALITTGVPFARGAVRDVAKLSAAIAKKGDGLKPALQTGDGLKPALQTVPAQFRALAPWDDGSVRWALMDVQADVPAGGKVELVVSDAGPSLAPAEPVKVDDAPDVLTVSTGPLQFVVGRRRANVIQSLKVDGKELITFGKGLVVYPESGGEVAAVGPAEVKVEQAGPMRAVICVRGRFPGIHNGLLGYTARISAYAGQKLVKVHAWLENHGAMGYYAAKDEGGTSPTIEWFPFRAMAVELGLGLGEAVTARCEGVEAPGGLRVLQLCKMTHGQEKVQYKKGPFYTWNDFEYAITTRGTEDPLKGGLQTEDRLKAGLRTRELKRGDRTDGVVELKGASGPLTVAIRDFWQTYEKAIEVDGKTLKLWLWPPEGQWPRPRPDLRTGGLFDKTLQKLPKDGLYFLPGGVHKGSEFILDFSGRDPRETAAELSAPLLALASAEHYAATEAAPGLFAPPDVRTSDRDCNARLAAWLRMTRSAADPLSPAGLVKARQVSVDSDVSYITDSMHWFGWMDFGDLPVPGHGPVGLHYDWTWVMLLGALRTGDMGFVRLATPMARHRIDVDQLWSDRDPPEVRGLQRGDFNFPSFHCYRLYRPPGVATNWLPGVALHYLLTGEPKALECCLRNAEGLKASWAWIDKTRPWAGPQEDMAANAASMSAYCALYKLTADRKWLDEALGLFKTHVAPKWKSQGPFLHDAANQIRSQDYVQEDMKYCYAIASLCELHHLTGDASLFKLLKEGTEKPFPASFFEAPLFLADLHAYVGYKMGKREGEAPAEPYLTRAADLFAQSFPESKCPPVYLPDNSVWSRTSAMTLRTGHLLQYAWWKRNEKK